MCIIEVACHFTIINTTHSSIMEINLMEDRFFMLQSL